MRIDEIALVGTSRAAAADASGTPIDDLVASIGDDVPLERRLLLTAGALAIYERAGTVAPSAPPRPDSAGEESQPACSPRAEALLREMLCEDHHGLLAEAFALLARAGRRLPPPLLPACLDLREAPLRDAIRPLLGERGRWLAGHRDDWQWATAFTAAVDEPLASLQQVWDEGRVEERVSALATIRARDTATARAWLASGWTKEKVADRLEFLAVLSTGLSAQDEAWLESVLDDRSAAVRAEIASLLARIPNSAFWQRAVARAAACLTWQAPARDIWSRVKASVAGAQAGKLHVEPPSEAGADWLRDGVQAKPPKETGERAHWLIEVLALVDPRHWTTAFHASPEQLVKAALQTEWADSLLAGWSRAALLHEANDWTPVLWDAWLTLPLNNNPDLMRAYGEWLDRLFAVLPADAAASRLTHVLEGGAERALDVTAAIGRFPAPWPDAVAATLLAALSDRWRAMNYQQQHESIALMEAAGAALPLSRLAETHVALAIDPLQPPSPARGRARDRLLTRLSLRHRLHEETLPLSSL